jgi:ribosomal-protein-alanine N-acetyltransferase
VININITCEPLSLNNLPDVLSIERVSFSEPWSEGLFLREMRHRNSHFVVFRLNLEVMGYGGFWLVRDEAHITNIAVHPLYRGQGYGAMILEHLLDTAVSRRASMATLEVRETNFIALNLYKKFGFRPVALQKGYYSDTGEDAIVMLKDDMYQHPAR